MNINRRSLAEHRLGLGSNDFPRWMVPALTRRVKEYRQLRAELEALKHIAAHCDNLGKLFDEIQQFPHFRTEQKRDELVPALELIASNPPRFLCEIGSGLGGTLFLLTRVCAPDALIITIDLTHSVVRSRINSLMAEKKQRIVSIRCDSAAPECLARLRSMLGGNSLDLLFIDGDHSFEGVAADFNNYSPLVKNNGLILFHDIVPDFKTRFGIETASWTGGVPEFWSLLAGKFQCQTWIHDPEQDGYGLGLIHWQQCQKSQ